MPILFIHLILRLFTKDNKLEIGKEIVSKKWIEESTKEHSRWKKLNLPYGYLWWLDNDKEYIFVAMGDDGNIIYVNNDKIL